LGLQCNRHELHEEKARAQAKSNHSKWDGHGSRFIWFEYKKP